jgi:hypothetical protein
VVALGCRSIFVRWEHRVKLAGMQDDFFCSPMRRRWANGGWRFRGKRGTVVAQQRLLCSGRPVPFGGDAVVG